MGIDMDMVSDLAVSINWGRALKGVCGAFWRNPQFCTNLWGLCTYSWVPHNLSELFGQHLAGSMYIYKYLHILSFFGGCGGVVVMGDLASRHCGRSRGISSLCLEEALHEQTDHKSPRFPVKDSSKGPIHTGIGIDMDIDSDMPASTNYGGALKGVDTGLL